MNRLTITRASCAAPPPRHIDPYRTDRRRGRDGWRCLVRRRAGHRCGGGGGGGGDDVHVTGRPCRAGAPSLTPAGRRRRHRRRRLFTVCSGSGSRRRRLTAGRPAGYALIADLLLSSPRCLSFQTRGGPRNSRVREQLCTDDQF